MGKKTVWVLAGIAVAAFLILGIIFAGNSRVNKISTYEACASAGYPVLESNPPQCKLPDGTILVQMENITVDSSGHERFARILSGQYSEVDKKENRIINSQKDWNDTLIQLAPSIGSFNIDNAVNFSNETAIAVFMGEKPTGGYSILINKIIEDNNKVKIYLSENIPEGCGVTEALTQPFDLIKIPKTRKQIEFVSESTTRKC